MTATNFAKVVLVLSLSFTYGCGSASPPIGVSAGRFTPRGLQYEVQSEDIFLIDAEEQIDAAWESAEHIWGFSSGGITGVKIVFTTSAFGCFKNFRPPTVVVKLRSTESCLFENDGENTLLHELSHVILRRQNIFDAMHTDLRWLLLPDARRALLRIHCELPQQAEVLVPPR